MLSFGIDRKRRACERVALKIQDQSRADRMATCAIVMRHGIRRLVQFDITPATRNALQACIRFAARSPEDRLFTSRLRDPRQLGARRYARILGHWVDAPCLDPRRLRNAMET